MNTLFRIGRCLILFFCLFKFLPLADAFDAGPSLSLERYTVLTNGQVQHDDGYLLSNGRFRVLDSEIYDSTLLDPSFDYTVISGRPICNVIDYAGYKAARIIPHWVSSHAEFQIGFSTFVIVSIAGGQDPNPLITITDQPKSQSLLAGDSVFFSVNASPLGYITFQWLRNGAILRGENTSVLLINNVMAKDAGNYSVTMTTGGKKTSSKKALLRIVQAVVVKTQPRAQSVKVGHGAVFRVAVSGTGPFTYQWYFNGVAIPHATRSFYSITKAQPADAGFYSVTIENAASGASALPAELTVTQ